MKRSLILLVLALTVLAGPARADVSFTRDVAPVLVKRCAGCHGERLSLGGYRAQTFANMLRPGASGAKPVVARKPEESRLFQLISDPSAARRMPRNDDPLAGAQVE